LYRIKYKQCKDQDWKKTCSKVQQNQEPDTTKTIATLVEQKQQPNPTQPKAKSSNPKPDSANQAANNVD